MGSPLYREYERLVTITVLGKPFQVPEKNTCLRVFQFISPDTIPYGRFCWNQECQLCRISYQVGLDRHEPPRSALACKLIVADGLEVTELSEELRYNLIGVIQPPDSAKTYREGYDL